MNETPSKRFTLGVVLFIGTSSLFGCKGETASSAPRPILEVQVVEITTQTVPDEPEFIGQAEASSIVEIRPQVTGIIKQRFFSEGRDVKQGDRLYEIDPVPFRAAFVSAKGRVAQVEARVVQAKQDLARVKPLLAEQAVSQKDVDDAVAEDLDSETGEDGLHGKEGTFNMRTFWLVEALARAGRVDRPKLDEARLLFERMLGYANHVGLYAEESGPVGKRSVTSPKRSPIWH